MTQFDPRDQQEIKRIRRQRNIVLGLALAGFVVLVYFISLARIG